VVRPWDAEKAGGPHSPFNPVTGKRYHGINVLILGMDMRTFQTGDPRWMTYQQAQGKDRQVRKGERSTTIFFTKPYEIEDEAAVSGSNHKESTKPSRSLRRFVHDVTLLNTDSNFSSTGRGIDRRPRAIPAERGR
jgi:antirestriction protein ArdC